VGGPAEVLFKPADEDDLIAFVEKTDPTIALTVIGVASNLLIRDGGIPGVVIKLGPQFATIKIDNTQIRAGAAAIDLNVARAAQASSLSGLEFLSGIPGTVGGGLAMNAGAYGREYKDIVIEAKALHRDGTCHTIRHEQFGFGYRHNNLNQNTIFISALLQGTIDNPGAISERMQSIQQSRGSTQPIREKTGGSTFANPTQDPQNRKAWQLIDAAGCRGLRKGDAMVSTMHCNFLINTDHATAADIEELGEEVKRRVFEQSGVQLYWEIKRLGIPLMSNPVRGAL
jgi:UDP-N-acetylmuramate dehydrogenase